MTSPRAPPTSATSTATNCRSASRVFQPYGGRHAFAGPVSTVRCFEDNSRVKEAVEARATAACWSWTAAARAGAHCSAATSGCAAVKNGWAGVIIHGCIRDSRRTRPLDLGIRALGTMPLRSEKRGEGERDVPVRFAGVTFRPGDYVYVDEDGVIVAHAAHSPERPTMARTVFCTYLQRDAEGLDRAPYPGELGQRIYASISKEAWQRLGAPPDDADERVSPDADRPEGAQVPGRGDGEVPVRRRREQARGLRPPESLSGARARRATPSSAHATMNDTPPSGATTPSQRGAPAVIR